MITLRSFCYLTWLLSIPLLVKRNTASAARISSPLTERHTRAANCLTHKNITVITPTNPDYANYSSPYNLRLQYTPEIIVLASTNKHVSDAVRCACRAGLKVQARSGGHSYASYSLGGEDGALIIDMQRFQDVNLEKTSQVATFGAGLRLGNLALALQEYGRAVPHGTCSIVGVGGHFTVGGNGFTSRAYGMAIDSLVAMDVVLADGTLVHATATDHPEVFFALRGAGSSFGIATTFYAQTFEIPTVTGIYLTWPGLIQDPNAGFAAVKHIQNFATNASSGIDRNLQFDVSFDVFGGFILKGVYLGSAQKFNTTVLPELLRGLPEPAAGDKDSPTFIKEYSWAESLVDASYGNMLQYPKPGEAGFVPTPDHDNFYIKSVNVPAPGLPDEALRNLLIWAQAHQEADGPAVPWYFTLLLQGGYDNQIYLESKSHEAAFWRRDLTWIIEFSGFTEDLEAVYPEPEGIELVNDLYDQAAGPLREASGALGAYNGVVDSELTAEEAGLLHYGEELFAKLKVLKRKLDPKDLFHNPQSIPVKGRR